MLHILLFLVVFNATCFLACQVSLFFFYSFPYMCKSCSIRVISAVSCPYWCWLIGPWEAALIKLYRKRLLLTGSSAWRDALIIMSNSHLKPCWRSSEFLLGLYNLLLKHCEPQSRSCTLKTTLFQLRLSVAEFVSWVSGKGPAHSFQRQAAQRPNLHIYFRRTVFASCYDLSSIQQRQCEFEQHLSVL